MTPSQGVKALAVAGLAIAWASGEPKRRPADDIPVRQVILVWAVATPVAIGGLRIGLRLVRRNRTLILFLRRFRYDDAQDAVTFAVLRTIGSSWRVVTLDDAELTFADIDAIVIGKAPDALEGVMMPELSLADALGAVGKPIHRVHTAGSVGASTAISGANLVESGRYDRVLVVYGAGHGNLLRQYAGESGFYRLEDTERWLAP